MKASKSDIATVLEVMTYAEDHAELGRVAKTYFPRATRCEVLQEITNNGFAIEALNFYDEDDNILSLPSIEGDALILIHNNDELTHLFKREDDPVDFLQKRYGAWENNYELQSTVFDDWVFFDFDVAPRVAKPLYTGLPGYVVVYPRDLNEPPEAHLAFSLEAAQTIAAHIAKEAYKYDATLKKLFRKEDYQAVIEYATEAFGFVCDMLEVS